ncbi:phosphomannomutase/phosphoglucomutase [bacterium]|nr:MAG: phosphomannomutase/phosphoglucomutase [bacterium]
MPIDPGIFHAYDIRGRYPEEVTPEAAYQVAFGLAQFLKHDLKKALPLRVALGMDMRGSSPFLAREIARGLNDQGIDVVEIGEVSTPAFYYAVAFNDFPAGVMVTASHMTKEFNGFKVCLEKAVPVGIDSGLKIIQKYSLSESAPKVTSKGTFSSLSNINHDYVAQDLSHVDVAKIKKYKIAADPANCMGATYLQELFNQIPSDPIKMNWDLNGNMPVHEANPLKLETLQQIQAIIKNEKADIGLATDGDGDRIAILDEQGEPIPGDMIMGMVALELLKKNPGARFVYDLRFSRSFADMIRQAGGDPVESRVGHSFIKFKMKEINALFAGELSGHFYYRENFNYESPVFVIGTILLIMSEAGKPLSEIWRQHVKYCHSGEINFTIADKEKAMAVLEKKYADPASTSRGEAGGKVSKLDGLKVDFDDWWFNVRPSANDPVLRLTLEAKDEAMMKEKVEEVSKVIVSI